MRLQLLYLLLEFYHACEIIKIELEYQNNEISEDEVRSKIDKLYEELEENENAFVIG